MSIWWWFGIGLGIALVVSIVRRWWRLTLWSLNGSIHLMAVAAFFEANGWMGGATCALWLAALVLDVLLLWKGKR